jgi:hypothetical protein
MLATIAHAVELPTVFSQSFAKRRHLPSQANVRNNNPENKIWTNEPEYSAHVKEAKQRELSCGVNSGKTGSKTDNKSFQKPASNCLTSGLMGPNSVI